MTKWWASLNTHQKGFVTAAAGFIVMLTGFFFESLGRWALYFGFAIFLLGTARMLYYWLSGQQRRDYEQSTKPAKQPWED